uniref:Uncharacterized protein n=1 Tax=Ditylum brightwellii TaxID=49249 RepID=A0A7S4W0L3_9STRA
MDEEKLERKKRLEQYTQQLWEMEAHPQKDLSASREQTSKTKKTKLVQLSQKWKNKRKQINQKCKSMMKKHKQEDNKKIDTKTEAYTKLKEDHDAYGTQASAKISQDVQKVEQRSWGLDEEV